MCLRASLRGVGLHFGEEKEQNRITRQKSNKGVSSRFMGLTAGCVFMLFASGLCQQPIREISLLQPMGQSHKSYFIL